ncbi:hypothetical protein [Kitasatospora sp. NPDC001175]
MQPTDRASPPRHTSVHLGMPDFRTNAGRLAQGSGARRPGKDESEP